MFIKTTFALAFAFATASGALAATKQQTFRPFSPLTTCMTRAARKSVPPGFQRPFRDAAGLGPGVLK
jgi:hypothetical protein